MTENQQRELILEAKSLLRTPRSGALATLQSGSPFNSLVTFATDYDGSPVFLLSQLAVHTQNLTADPRCALLVGRPGKGDPLAHPRLTVLGAATPDHAPHLRARFLARQPKAALYADFADFRFFRMKVTGLHLNGGFARAADFTAPDVLTPVEQPAHFITHAPAALEFLNTAHLDLLRQTVARQHKSPPQSWQASGIDPEGIDVICGEQTARLNVSLAVIDNNSLIEKLKAL